MIKVIDTERLKQLERNDLITRVYFEGVCHTDHRYFIVTVKWVNGTLEEFLLRR